VGAGVEPRADPEIQPTCTATHSRRVRFRVACAAMARVLAFDTSATVTSVAVCDGSRVLAEDDSVSGDRHAELLLPRVERCLAQSGLTLGDIDLIGVGIGPGSFTGVRVGVATAKGFGLSLQKPVCGVVSLTALAEAAAGAAVRAALVRDGEWLAPLLDAFKGEVFGALYRVTPQGVLLELEPFHAAPAAALARISAAVGSHPLTLFGAGLRRYAAEFGELPSDARLLEPAFDVPRARFVASLAEQAVARGEVVELAQLAPLYLRDSDAQLPKIPLRL
jgi:tRNA threonylcarbamoyladenosine biosynthesis protein TsaB